MKQERLNQFVQECIPAPQVDPARLERISRQVMARLDTPPAPVLPWWMRPSPSLSRYGMPLALGALSGLGLSQWVSRQPSQSGMADLFHSLYSLPMGF